MRRKSLDQILSLTGLVVTVVLVVVGMLLMWGGNFAKDTVTAQLSVQNITFDADAANLPPELSQWAGVAVTDGDSGRQCDAALDDLGVGGRGRDRAGAV